jgi:type IV pilus assembly protein PilB
MGKRIGDLLIEGGAINEEQLDAALKYKKAQKEKNGKDLKLGECLINMGATTDRKIAEAIGQQLRMQVVDLSKMELNPDVVNMVKSDVLRKLVCIPIAYKDNTLTVAMADPLDYDGIDSISMITNSICEPVVAPQSQVMAALDKFFGSEETAEAAEQYSKEREKFEEAENNAKKAEEEALSDAPIVKMVRTIIERAARSRASDIHIDALEQVVRVRYRIDGVLQQGQKDLPISFLPGLSTRIKIMSGLDISEKRKPQDGRITMIVDHKEYDIRVAILPTSFGEKTVMRLAEANTLSKSKEDLGLQPHEMKLFNHIIKRPNGIILVTGPTGSGKSTTLYTALSELNTPEVNIMTVEDPVEANIPGINQVQVNVKAGLTFAAALRSFLRQDPDIIMVGEIRDQETAEIAVQASITGHLVVSTLHTNSAAASVTRLIDMGIAPYLLADSLTGIIAQRLVRRLCKECMRFQRASKLELLELGIGDDSQMTTTLPKGARFANVPGGRVPEESSRGTAVGDDGVPVAVAETDIKVPGLWVGCPVGCEACKGTGYYGRIGVYEVMEVTEHLRDIIAKNEGTEVIEAEAKKNGLRTLRENAAELIIQGTTTVSEMLKITMDDFSEKKEEEIEEVKKQQSSGLVSMVDDTSSATGS